MKDKVARDLLVELANAVGCEIGILNSGFVLSSSRRSGFTVRSWGVDSLYRTVNVLKNNMRALRDEIEAARPTCKSCGQKIQDGFREGDVEAVAAAVRKADKKR